MPDYRAYDESDRAYIVSLYAQAFGDSEGQAEVGPLPGKAQCVAAFNQPQIW